MEPTQFGDVQNIKRTTTETAHYQNDQSQNDPGQKRPTIKTAYLYIVV